MGSCAGFDERRRDAFKRFRATDEDKPVIDTRADAFSCDGNAQCVHNVADLDLLVFDEFFQRFF